MSERLSPRMKALTEAAEIAERRARSCGAAETRYPAGSRSAATERSAKFEAELIAHLIRLQMQNRRAKP